METSPQAINSYTAVGSEMENVPSGLMLTDNQHFLLYFIMGTYFAPDIVGERPQKSILQRHAKDLPRYESDQLAGSHIRISELERVYYYVLRNADQSVIVKPPWLHKFFRGELPIPAQDLAVAYPQFNDLFPPHLHPHSEIKNRDHSIANVVFANDPDVSYIKPEDIERFKTLTRLSDLFLDRDATLMHPILDDNVLYNAEVEDTKLNGALPAPKSSCASKRAIPSSDCSEPEDLVQHSLVVKPVSSVPYNSTTAVSSLTRNCAPPISCVFHSGTPPVNCSTCNGAPLTFSHMASFSTEVSNSPTEKFGPGMIYLPSFPTREEWSNIVAATKTGSALTGSAAMGQIGPVIGLLDIGECEDSYLFRVSLPGVKRDERDFSCEVESDGKVLIRGVTATGEKTICRYSQVFEMKSQNLCPPGHFSISFKLPGPVDPQQFSGNFGTDGILEGIVVKDVHNRL
ncbi:hypothetical protein RJ640_025034 [Escallonia rubra]|uniref:SHSP domain-containing protein n=1 Tax=Escallonia rubra TaxID=112253 RepID=A0AA88U8Y1_9ASTE|nr:hypothetical protein RJ640_025034 [Escallonia rubra]